MKAQSNIQDTVQQIQSDIDEIATRTKNLRNGERFAQIQRMNDLRYIATTLEDIDKSVSTLIEQGNKRKLDHT